MMENYSKILMSSNNREYKSKTLINETKCTMKASLDQAIAENESFDRKCIFWKRMMKMHFLNANDEDLFSNANKENAFLNENDEDACSRCKFSDL